MSHAAVCDEQCSLHGGVCDNGTCEFRCSDYGKYTCQNSSTLLSTLSVCKNVLGNDISGQHCAPREPSILQQLEEVVVMPNYHRLFPGGARKLFNIFGSTYCDEAAKRLACWVNLIFPWQIYFFDISFCYIYLIFHLAYTNETLAPNLLKLRTPVISFFNDLPPFYIIEKRPMSFTK